MQDRLITLEGVRNFRDFGGYETAEGRRVAKGALFRSAHFAEATEADLDRIAALNITLICDLRRPEERDAQPSRWPAQPAARVLSSDEGGKAEAPHLSFLKTGDLSPVAVGGYMRGMYREIPFDPRYVSLFSGFLKGVAAGEAPALVHCAAGKDRTGILCALTLLALDVPKDAVMADYELTNAAVDLEGRMPRVQERFAEATGRKIPREAVLPLLGVEASYLEASLAALEERCGGAHGYIADVLGLPEPTRRRLRERLVE